MNKDKVFCSDCGKHIIDEEDDLWTLSGCDLTLCTVCKDKREYEEMGED